MKRYGMSYGVMAYLVDFDKLVALCGSGDDQTRRMISGRFRERISRLNTDLDWSNERGEPSVFEAIRHLVMGDEKTLDGAMYGYGFKFVVEFLGRSLDNAPFYPCSSDHLSAVDAQLAEVGASIRMTGLVFGGAPVSFPHPDDFPSIGHWNPAQVAQGVEPLRAGTSNELRTIAKWLDQTATADQGIVGFYH